MTGLEALIREQIGRDGPISVSDYMALALAHPEHGYYRKADPLGARGDFITAPEVSQMFGELIGLWCVVTWRQAGRPAPFNLIELGPGRGTLMADALRACQAVPDFVDTADLHLVEISPGLQTQQAAALRDYAPIWHSSIEDLPAGPAIVIANEFFDALPIDQYVRTPQGWRLRCVEIDPASGALSFVASPDRAVPEGLVPSEAENAPVGSIFEHCPAALVNAKEIGRRLAADGIAALAIDYGYLRRAAGDTLQAVRRHRRHDALAEPGDADLTAHVDFAALAAAAGAEGAKPWGPVTQGAFLSGLGIEARTENLAANADDKQAALMRSGCRRLIAADGMGSLFKVLALTGPDADAPAGFESLGAEGQET